MTDYEEDAEYERKMAAIGKPYYRFADGTFVKANSFEEAKQVLIAQIEAEQEKENRWLACTCTGLSHRHGCPVQEAEGIPY